MLSDGAITDFHTRSAELSSIKVLSGSTNVFTAGACIDLLLDHHVLPPLLGCQCLEPLATERGFTEAFSWLFYPRRKAHSLLMRQLVFS
jgi:hypothetical protein